MCHAKFTVNLMDSQKDLVKSSAAEDAVAMFGVVYRCWIRNLFLVR
jgi:hypothetical protein